jgi:hypothetical protein
MSKEAVRLQVSSFELSDLPFTDQEHFCEAHKSSSIGLQEGISAYSYFLRLFRGVITAAIFVLYVCSATAAYFVFDPRHNDL